MDFRLAILLIVSNGVYLLSLYNNKVIQEKIAFVR